MEVKGRHKMIPDKCHLWKNGEAMTDEKAVFDQVISYVHQSHLLRDLLRCKDCGQLYFSEFYEVVDWVGGNDSQYSTYIPVASESEAAALSRLSPHELLAFSPRLVDVRGEAGKTIFRWVR